MNISILVGLILLNGFFAMAEIALVTARRSRLARMAENGDKGAENALNLGQDPTQFLSTIQIGITAIGVLSGIFGEAAISAPLAEWLQTKGLSVSASGTTATVIVVMLITYFSIVLGELVPKRIGQGSAEGIARLVARPIALLAAVSRPFVLLLSLSTNGLLRILGKKDQSSENLTEEDIHAILEEGSESGVIEKQEHDIVRNVFRLDERQIASLMTPRSDISFLDISQPTEQILQQVLDSEYSRFPVCRHGLDTMLGMVTTKQVLRDALKNGLTNLEAHIQPCVYVPESLTGMKLLEQFRASGMQMVFVVDEYGDIMGLITLQDVLEALAGEFTPHNPEDVWAVQREDGSWLLDGLMPIPELKDLLLLRNVPSEEKGRYHTVSGLIMWLTGRLPATADTVVWEQWRFEVVDMDGHRIDKVLATRIEEKNAEEQA